MLALKRMIGGAADDTTAPSSDQWLGGASGDTCILRMSHAFKYSGAHIPQPAQHMVTVRGADRLRYGFRAREFDARVRSSDGPPDIEVKGKSVSREKFRGKVGFISFDITFGLTPDGRTRATGHIDPWDGVTFFDEINGISRPDRNFFNVADGMALRLAPGKANMPRF
ncbi:hypothetical protein ANI02nite_19720 [Acetobacter nitrogenifigens DSM 23921 = NBRC 105050]|uniref:Uncharacterized protein n=2 Tax=Acetobacter nitrogenifigens TaxID=285268 RepID=A0A511XAU8_9PROT|nr:type VI secretion system amidase effector protein Tae4 [Acetobacter nitrogenifigens]GEN60088.1 hypothetical protein ANI02nite_19720 [Acetobacter nitrogenifigens DSM 23921 = NBRC 105050]